MCDSSIDELLPSTSTLVTFEFSLIIRCTLSLSTALADVTLFNVTLPEVILINGTLPDVNVTLGAEMFIWTYLLLIV